MEIRGGLEGLRSLLGLDVASQATAPARPQGSPAPAGADRASLSAAASEMSQPENGDGVRSEKVAAVQAALAAGTYHVPAASVAAKLVDSMLGGEP
jgi:flagellar biosynthesis anti-sigma factor FlgM